MKKADKRFLILMIVGAILILVTLTLSTAIGYRYFISNNLAREAVDEITQPVTTESNTEDKSVCAKQNADITLLKNNATQLEKALFACKKTLKENNSTSSSSVSVTTHSNTPTKTCITYNIREGEFKSNKCYSPQNYDDLGYYISKYNSAISNKDFAESSIKITCSSGSDFFKDSCEEDKRDKDTAEKDIKNYREKIVNIISKGE